MAFVLYKNEVRWLVRQDHFGDPNMWLTQVRKENSLGQALLVWVSAKDCVLLDPALNILFERNEDD